VEYAVKPAGQGGVSAALVVKITQDIPVYRMWNGPGDVNAQGNTNRLGGWWSYDAPHGPVDGYRVAYEICRDWNKLKWVATCTLKAGPAATRPAPSNTRPTRWIGRRLSINRGRAPAS
jgi:hypothetical protein